MNIRHVVPWAAICREDAVTKENTASRLLEEDGGCCINIVVAVGITIFLFVLFVRLFSFLLIFLSVRVGKKQC